MLAGQVRRTPMIDVEGGAFGKAPVTLKLELLQHTGSFKARGAYHALSRAKDLPDVGVVAASGGNHGLAVAWAARQIGRPATIFVPTTTPATKLQGLHRLGADIRQVGARYAESLAAAVALAEQTGAFTVHAYDDPDVVAGQGTLGLELLADRPGFDTVLISIGGGGLAGGVATALDGRARLVGVEPVGCPTWYAARAAGEPVDVAVGGLASDALGATRLGRYAYAALSAADAPSLLVDEDAVRAARTLLWRELHVAAEPGGVVALAALMSGAYQPADDERVVVVICGGNAEPADLT